LNTELNRTQQGLLYNVAGLLPKFVRKHVNVALIFIRQIKCYWMVSIAEPAHDCIQESIVCAAPTGTILIEKSICETKGDFHR
jgi:hypothetical protein